MCFFMLFFHVQDKLALIKRQQTASCEPTDIGVMVLLQLQQEGESHINTPSGWLYSPNHLYFLHWLFGFYFHVMWGNN